MVYNDTTNNQGIIQECESQLFASNYGAISGNTPLLQTFTRYANQALDHIASLIMQSDGRWQWDDSNNTDHPIATTNVISGQKDYSFATSHLRIFRVEYTDSNGQTSRLLPIDQSDITTSENNFEGTNGVPKFYDKTGNSLFLYPTPAENVTAGLKVYFQRGFNYFTTASTNTEPGFASTHHRLVALWMCYYYAAANVMPDIRDDLAKQITVQEDLLQDFYLTRSKDEPIRLRPLNNRTNWR